MSKNDKITLSREEYEELVTQLEKSATTPKSEYKLTITSKEFWDHFMTKLASMLLSLKVWVLISVLYVPYELLRQELITADNYVQIIIVVAPVVVGLREFSKATQNGNANEGEGFLGRVKRIFKI